MHGAYDVHNVLVITSRGVCASGLERMQVCECASHCVHVYDEKEKKKYLSEGSPAKVSSTLTSGFLPASIELCEGEKRGKSVL